MIARARDILPKFTCPLVHPPDFSVRVRDGMVRLYKDGCLDIEGTPWAVEHDPIRNGDRRVELLAACEDDLEIQQQFLWAVSRNSPASLILWFNTFAWTYVQSEIDAEGHEAPLIPARVDPMVLWPCQDEFATELFYAITKGYDWCVDKSRQMGATWLIAGTYLWFFLYRPEVHFDVISKTEEDVDNKGDPQSIFWKLDFIIEHLPTWLMPTIERTYMSLINQDLKCSIIGRSTTAKKGRGGKKTSVLFDEAALNDHLRSMWVGYGKSCSSRGANSTPFGPGYFAELIRENANVHKIILPWWNHPQKGKGRFIDEYENERFISSPYYISECRRESPNPEQPYMSRKFPAIAQELDMSHEGGAGAVFSSAIINRQMDLCPPFPEYRGDLVWTGPKGTRLPAIKRGQFDYTEFQESLKGRWEFWCEFFEDDNGMWRPNQHRNYVAGCDIAQGTGASESTMSVFCVEESRKVAQFRSAHIDPERFALLAAMVGYWFGGDRGGMLIAPEANGLGQSFISTLRRVAYPYIWQEREVLKKGGKIVAVYGWNSNKQKKRTVFDQFNSAMGRGEYMNPSREALRQAAGIINYPEGGGIGPAILSESSEDARALHADLVTADALSWYAAQHVGFTRPVVAPARRGTQAYLRQHPEVIRG